MAVDVFSETCKLHLGIEDCRYHFPVYQGDTLDCKIQIVGISELTSSGNKRIIESLHALFNQNGQLVFSLLKKSLFEGKELENLRAGEISFGNTVLGDERKKETFREAITRTRFFADELSEERVHRIRSPLSENQLLLHGMVKPISISDNLSFCNLMRNSHSLHYNHERYGKKNKIIISGGYVLASVLGNASRDFRETLYHQMHKTMHIGKLRLMESLGAVSYISSIKPVDGAPDYEELQIKTIGVRGMDIENSLKDVSIPLAIFQEGDVSFKKAKEFNQFCETHIMDLFHRIVVYVHRTIIRPTIKK